ncbi:MAG: hypothetical protein ACRC7O_11775, partial [Fimbriiglobus sp.]
MTDFDDDENGYRRPREVPFPGKIRVAGILWLTFGGLAILSGLLTIVLGAASGAPPKPVENCGNCCTFLFGLAFVWVGYTTVRGTAADTFGNAIGSLLFGTLYFGMGLLIGLGGAAIFGGAGGPAGAGGPPPGVAAAMATVML